MVLTQEQREHYLTLKAREEAKGKSLMKRTPALFRETALDTHKTTPPEYWGPSIIPEKEPPTYRHSRSAQQRTTANSTRAAQLLESLNEKRSQSVNTFRSVFKPTVGQGPVCDAAKQRRDNVYNSEWALLDTFDVAMFMGEKDQRGQTLRTVQRGQKTFLDSQMQEREQQRQAEVAEAAKEREVVLASVEKYRAEERARAELERARHQKLKADTEEMLATVNAQKQAAKAARREEEARMLRDIEAQMEADKRRAAAKVEEARQAMERTRADNEARLRARTQAEALQRARDEELMQQTIATLEKQEREREERVKDFHDMIQRRANKAGQKAVEENRARQEREDRLVREAEAQAEARAQAREAAERDKRARQKRELLEAREAHLLAKAAKEEEARQEAARLMAEAEARERAEQEAEDRKMAGLRARAANNQTYIRGQMTLRDEAAKLDDVFMSPQELKLNKKLLDQAQATVGRPMQYSVKLY